MISELFYPVLLLIQVFLRLGAPHRAAGQGLTSQGPSHHSSQEQGGLGGSQCSTSPAHQAPPWEQGQAKARQSHQVSKIGWGSGSAGIKPGRDMIAQARTGGPVSSAAPKHEKGEHPHFSPDSSRSFSSQSSPTVWLKVQTHVISELSGGQGVQPGGGVDQSWGPGHGCLQSHLKLIPTLWTRSDQKLLLVYGFVTMLCTNFMVISPL